MEHLEYPELRTKLDEIEKQKSEVEKALMAKRNDRKRELLAAFKQRVEDEGFTLHEVCPLRSAGKNRRGNGSERTFAVYVSNDDPEKTYVRGPLPSWMKEKMAGLGLDPSSKEDRDRYKADYMHLQN